tara:strand:- start:5135 stop:5818 length:684 start_codon:yes stop_codon:yes gene_type:complete
MKTPHLIDPDMHVSELVLHHPWSWSVLRSHNIDVCCGGDSTLSVACDRNSVDLEALQNEILKSDVVPPELVFWDQRPASDLIEHILDRFHAKHRRDLPVFLEMAQACEIAHGSGPDWPEDLLAHLEHMAAELELHMRKEEEVLFPLILRGMGRHALTPIGVMKGEHEDHGDHLKRMREMTDQFRAPAHACATWVGLYRNLATLEDELMMHIHLENNLLFPRVLKGEG